MGKKSDHDLFMAVWKDCEAAERRRKWEKEKEEMEKVCESAKQSLASAWEEVNAFTSKYGTPRR